MLLKLALTGVLAVAGVSLPQVPARADTSPSSAWSQDGYGPGNNTWNPNEQIVTARRVAGLKLRWSVDSGPEGAPCSRAGTPPVVANGRVFVLDYATNGITARDAKTGERLWRFSGASFDALGIAVIGNRLVAVDAPCDPRTGAPSHVVALDVKTGDVRWRKPTDLRIFSFVVDAGTVVAATYHGAGPDPGAGSVAFRVSDGGLLWERDDVLAGQVSAQGRVMMADQNTRTWTAVSITTGRRIWHTGIETTAEAADPDGVRFYLTNARGLRAVDAASGRPLWRIPGLGGPVCDDGQRLYLGGGELFHTGAGVAVVSAWEPATGKLLWWRGLDGAQRMVRTTDLLIVGTVGQVAFLSPEDGSVAAPARGLAAMNNHPVVAGGKLYLTDRTALRVYAP
ncbi:PQQ-binding-like beta-propeller repeat protein [Actinoplanes sp. NPDC026623]|uniref:outer membrane protein assembly factor BamB family protein n=1 Tax=Actinoplanes sp. NPDC026623 TaxID=3155610 RepID=UPI0033E69EA2